MRIIIAGIIILLSFIFFEACQSKTAEGRALTKFPEGRSAYISKCSACHRLYDRDEYTPEKWDRILDIMDKKAKLSENEKELIKAYLTEDTLYTTEKGRQNQK